jgi:excisionase family DNA binding protein
LNVTQADSIGPDDIFSIDQAAGYLKVPKSTLYTLVREGRIPSHKVGRHWRFRKAAIDRWLDQPCPSPVAGETPAGDPQ